MASSADSTLQRIFILLRARTGHDFSQYKQKTIQRRISRRMAVQQIEQIEDYYQYLRHAPLEVNLLIGEFLIGVTEFFRNPEAFETLGQLALPSLFSARPPEEPIRVWVPACASGEEAYSIAMTLAEALPSNPWEIVGSDISTKVLAKAAAGHYSLARTEGIPNGYMRKYCLKGVRSHAGTFLIAPELRKRTRFYQINLMHPVDADIGDFDVIFLRNVMIYFDPETKARVVHNLLPRLKQGGHLIIGHSETLNGITDRVVGVRPTIYRKP